MKILLHSACTALALLTLSAGAFAKTGWTEDYQKGLDEAKAGKKITLVDFTGSDWCSWCIKLDKEVFSQAKFKDYAKDKLVLVEIDFPQAKPLPKEQQEKHEALAKKYDVQGFPTVVVLDSHGKKIGQVGYVPGGPEAFIKELEKLTTK